MDTAGYQNRLNRYFNGTIFAPSDHAFENWALDMKTDEELLLKNRPLLRHVLSYHIINNKVLLKEKMKPMQTWHTDLYRAYITIYKSRYGPVRILFGELLLRGNGFEYDAFASITRPNLKSERGVMHMVDRVILPPKGEI